MKESKRISDTYFEKPKWSKTWSRIPVKGVYGSEDVSAIDYEKDLNKPGEYPYTRGIFSNMYRGRLWTIRQLSGFNTPEEGNKLFRHEYELGQTGFSIALDIPTTWGLDSDDPRCFGDVGMTGVQGYFEFRKTV